MSIINFDGTLNQDLEDQRDAFKRLQATKSDQRFKSARSPQNVDQLSQRLPFSWRGKGYPILDIKIDINHDLAQHKYPNTPSARVEDTGRNPAQISATLIFVNTILPAANESWAYGNLYPAAYAAFVQDMFDGSIGTIIHPSFGSIQCRPVSCNASMDGKFRGGEMVQAVWIETIDDDNLSTTTDVLLQNINNLSQMSTTANALDSAISSLVPDPDSFGIVPPEGGFSGLVSAVKGAIDKTQLIGETALSSVSGLLYQVKQIITSCANFDDVRLALVNSFAYQLFNQAIKHKLNLDFTFKNSTIGIYANRSNTTLANLALVLGNSITDISNLNPSLTKSVRVPAFIPIRYYK